METTSSKHRSSDGDWICSDPACANLNFARRTTCNRCSKEREIVSKKKLGQEIGKAAAEKSKGLFSADDWLCNKCCNINWARRQQCNMCNAPKFGDAEQRTGYGGGYNDRGIVEYVRRDDSDDEYDEFGRRKKKKHEREKDKNALKSSKKRSATESEEEILEPEVEKEREEEEDDDSEDLSKYDLTEWDDLAAEVDQKNKDRDLRPKKKNLSRERSRSRSPSYW